MTMNIGHEPGDEADDAAPVEMLAQLFEALKAAAFDGWIIVEQDRVVQADTDTAGSARRNREYVRRHLGD